MARNALQCEPAVILLAEDDHGDQLLTREAFKSFQFAYDLRVVADGKEALDYLYKQGEYVSAEAPEPDLILLDLNMPRVNGQEVAEKIHEDTRLCKIPIVVLTTSRRQEDVLHLYGKGVASFISKPMDFQQFLARVRELEHLVRFMLEVKSLRDRERLTDRQIKRLARRREQLKLEADRLFENHMRQIETIFGQNEHLANQQGTSPAHPVNAGEASGRQALLALACKILEGRPEGRAPAFKPAAAPPNPGTGRVLWNEPCDTSQGLARLAERLDSLEDQSERTQPAAGAKPQDASKLAGH
jgi:two-component system response regulator